MHYAEAARRSTAATTPAPELGYDQRGYNHPRVAGAGPDIGAFEFADRIFQDGFD